MKRYSISYPSRVNEQTSKSGVKFYYGGRTDDLEGTIERYKSDRRCMGMQITDSVTKKVVFSDLRECVAKEVHTLQNGKTVEINVYA